jgi:hypothetical protein
MTESARTPDMYSTVPFCELPGVVQSIGSIVAAINTNPGKYGRDPLINIATTFDGTLGTVHSRSLTATLISLCTPSDYVGNGGRPVHPKASINIEPGSKFKTWVQAPNDPNAKQYLAKGLEKLALQMVSSRRKRNEVLLNVLRRLLIDTGVWRYECETAQPTNQGIPSELSHLLTGTTFLEYSLPTGDRE